MNNIQKLIENGGWRPIEECDLAHAANTYQRFLLKDSEDDNEPYTGYFYDWGRRSANPPTDEYASEEDYPDRWDSDIEGHLDPQPKFFMPLDTPERMAKVIEHLAGALRYYRGVAFDGAHVDGVLDEANKIAGGEDA